MAGTELGVGYVSLTASGRGFGRSIIREASAAGSSAGDSASRNFGSRFVSGMGAIGRRAGLALTAGIGAAGFFGIKTAANFEQTRIAFEGILGDVGKANRLLGDLRDFAARTPFEFTGLADSAKQLLAVGFEADEILPTMTTLGNVAATLGVGEAEIAGVVRALGQMKGKGKASAEELQQISEQVPGFSAIKAIAEDMGISTAEAFDKMAAGAVPADEAIESILNGMEEFPGASGAMERQSKTLNGVMSTLKDTLAGMAIDFITPYLPALSRGVETFSGWLQGPVIRGLESFVGWIGGIIGYWGPGLVTLFEEHLIPTVKGLAEDGLQAITDWWDRNGEDVKGFFTGFADVVGGAATTIGDWIWNTVLPAFRDLGAWLIDHEEVLKSILFGLAAGMTAYAVAATIAAIANVIALLPFYLILAAIVLVAGALFYAWQKSEAFRSAVTQMAIAAMVMGGVLIGFFQQLWDWVTRAWNAAGDLISRIGKILELVKELPDKLIPFDGSGGFPGGAANPLNWFDAGGTVPGPRGSPQIIGAHGGETILPTHKAEISSLVGGSGDVNINVTAHPGEGQLQAGVRAIKWHRTVQQAVSSR